MQQIFRKKCQMCQPTYMRCGILFPVRGNNGPAERKAHDVHTSSPTVHRVVCCPLCECLWKPVWKTSYMVMPACFLCAEEGEQCPDCGLVSHCKAHRKVFPYKSRHSLCQTKYDYWPILLKMYQKLILIPGASPFLPMPTVHIENHDQCWQNCCRNQVNWMKAKPILVEMNQ